MKRTQLIILAALLAVAACATTPAEQSAEARAQAVIASPIRTDQDRRMDASRNPAQFLPFTGVKPGMVVLDVSAGAGYTSQLLALSVGPQGKVYAQRQQPGDALTRRLADHPQANFIPVYQSFDDPVPANAPRLDLVTIVNSCSTARASSCDEDARTMEVELAIDLREGGYAVWQA